MKKIVALFALALAVLAVAPAAQAQETPQPMVATYDALANAVLALRQAEFDFMVTLLGTHYGHAEAAVKRGDYEGAAAQMALVANEGDNAIAGIRKRLLEGGHHHHHADGTGHHHADDQGHHADDSGSHHADDEGNAEYEAGYMVVTKAAKAEMLAAAAAMRAAADEAAAMAAWQQFDAVYKPLFE